MFAFFLFWWGGGGVRNPSHADQTGWDFACLNYRGVAAKPSRPGWPFEQNTLPTYCAVLQGSNTICLRINIDKTKIMLNNSVSQKRITLEDQEI
jgi:hypothetical protein